MCPFCTGLHNACSRPCFPSACPHAQCQDRSGISCCSCNQSPLSARADQRCCSYTFPYLYPTFYPFGLYPATNHGYLPPASCALSHDLHRDHNCGAKLSNATRPPVHIAEDAQKSSEKAFVPESETLAPFDQPLAAGEAAGIGSSAQKTSPKRERKSLEPDSIPDSARILKPRVRFADQNQHGSANDHMDSADYSTARSEMHIESCQTTEPFDTLYEPEPDLQGIRYYLSSDPAFRRHIPGYTRSQKTIVKKQAEKFSLKDGKLYFTKKGDAVLYVENKQHRQQLLKGFHNFGHPRRDEMLDKLSPKYYWKTIRPDIETFINKCSPCQQTGKGVVKVRDTLQHIAMRSKAWYLVSMDTLNMNTRTERGNQLLLTMVDCYTKYPVAVPIPNKSAEAVAKAVYDVYCLYGCPNRVITDNGKEFCNQINKFLNDTFRIKHCLIRPYHPRANGFVERVNRTIREHVRRECMEHEDTWDLHIGQILLYIRHKKHTATGYTPHELFHTFPLRRDAGDGVQEDEERFLALDKVDGSDLDALVNQECTDLVERLRAVRDAVETDTVGNINHERKRQKKCFDTRQLGKGEILKPGDLVWFSDKNRRNKVHGKVSKLLKGPARVVAVKSTEAKLQYGRSEKWYKNDDIRIPKTDLKSRQSFPKAIRRPKAGTASPEVENAQSVAEFPWDSMPMPDDYAPTEAPKALTAMDAAEPYDMRHFATAKKCSVLQVDIDAILSDKTITPDVVNVMSELIKQEAPAVSGLLHTYGTRAKTFTGLLKEGVVSCQIHFDDENHYCVSSWNAKSEQIDLFDTMAKPLTDNLRFQLWKCYGQNCDSIEVKFMPVQYQQDSINCGFFAMAIAADIALFAPSPCMCTYDPKELREWTFSCIRDEKICLPPRKSDIKLHRVSKDSVPTEITLDEFNKISAKITAEMYEAMTRKPRLMDDGKRNAMNPAAEKMPRDALQQNQSVQGEAPNRESLLKPCTTVSHNTRSEAQAAVSKGVLMETSRKPLDGNPVAHVLVREESVTTVERSQVPTDENKDSGCGISYPFTSDIAKKLNLEKTETPIAAMGSQAAHTPAVEKGLALPQASLPVKPIKLTNTHFAITDKADFVDALELLGAFQDVTKKSLPRNMCGLWHPACTNLERHNFDGVRKEVADRKLWVQIMGLSKNRYALAVCGSLGYVHIYESTNAPITDELIKQCWKLFGTNESDLQIELADIRFPSERTALFSLLYATERLCGSNVASRQYGSDQELTDWFNKCVENNAFYLPPYKRPARVAASERPRQPRSVVTVNSERYSKALDNICAATSEQRRLFRQLREEINSIQSDQGSSTDGDGSSEPHPDKQVPKLDSKTLPSSTWTCTLAASSLQNILKAGAWITGAVLREFCQILESQFPHLAGLGTVESASNERALQGNGRTVFHRDCAFLRIVHIHGNHFVVMESVQSPDEQSTFVVNVFDSLAAEMGTADDSELMVVAASFANTTKMHIELRLLKCDQQPNHSDCGVYSAAFATARCNKMNLSECAFDHSQIRHHLRQCLTSGHVLPFPTTRERSVQDPFVVAGRESHRYEVYCYCRMPNLDPATPLVKCRFNSCPIKLFHPGCIQKKGRFTCDLCLKKKAVPDK